MTGTANFQDVKVDAKTSGKNPLLLFLAGWFLLNLAQGYFTELTSDEGYYWFYAQHLQAGYYDHPPMVALLIKLGSAMLPSELGVRFFNVLLSTAGLYFFFTLLPDAWKQSRKTYLVLLSAPLLHYLCFIIFPDGPLLFFSLLFLVVYKRFLTKQNLANTFLLGLAMAFMAWSKYHGALVVLFTVLANLKLLKSLPFYLSLLVALLLFAPHLWWQYQNGFPTFQYHLSGRTGTVSFKHVGEYISQQIFAIGPGLIFIPFVIKAKDIFERTLKFIIIGTFLFFLLSSFKTFVHFHWTSIAVFPLLYFAVKYYNSPARNNLFNWLILPFVMLFFVIRLLLIAPVIPAMHVGEDYYHGRENWAQEISAVADDRPVFMPNNLREASLYSFYSGKRGVTLYSRPEKHSQYELWGYEDSLQGRDVLFVTKYSFNGSRPLANSLQQNLHYVVLTSFTSYYNNVEIDANVITQTNDSIEVSLTVINHRAAPLLFSELNGELASLICSIEKEEKVIRADVVKLFSQTDSVAAHHTWKVSVSLKDLPPATYNLYFGIRNGLLPDAILSKRVEVRVAK